MVQTALITGASRGLGKTVATFLAARGYDLIITARGQNALAETADELRSLGAHVVAIAGDVRDAGHRARLAAAIDEHGRLDLLVNNASILGTSPQPHLADYPLETLENVIDVNVLAPLGLIQTTLPMIRQAQGLIVNISSDAAVGGYEGWGGYGAGKAALDLLSRTLAVELADDGVAVVAVDPGDMRTQMHQEAFPGEDIGDRPEPEVTLPFWAWLLGQTPAHVNGQRFQAQGEQWLAQAAPTR